MKKIIYKDLNSPQQETFNFQKFSGILADYGYATIKLNDDWESADFLAQHKDGKKYLKVQLKSRLTFDKKYIGKKLYVCFPYQNKKSDRKDWYLFEHDKLLKILLDNPKTSFAKTSYWRKKGNYHWGTLNPLKLEILDKYSMLHAITT